MTNRNTSFPGKVTCYNLRAFCKLACPRLADDMHLYKFSLSRQKQAETATRQCLCSSRIFFYSWCFDWIIVNLQATIFVLHKVSKNSACVTKNPKQARASSRYAGDREKGLKILGLPPNTVELHDGYTLGVSLRGSDLSLFTLN